MSEHGNVKIISDGTGYTTTILDEDGHPIRWGRSGVVKIELRPIDLGGLVQAVFTVDNVALDIVATPVRKPPSLTVVKS